MMLEDTRLDQSGRLEDHEAARSSSEREHSLRLICDKNSSMLVKAWLIAVKNHSPNIISTPTEPRKLELDLCSLVSWKT
jgi:hypothetical protein